MHARVCRAGAVPYAGRCAKRRGTALAQNTNATRCVFHAMWECSVGISSCKAVSAWYARVRGLATRASAQQDSEQGVAGLPVLSRVCVESFPCAQRHGADLVCGSSIGAVCAMLEVGVTSDDDVVRPDVKYPPPEAAMVSVVCTTETGKQTIHAGKGGGADRG